jgi:hypothetical protein
MDRPALVEALAGIAGTWSSPRGDSAALAEARRALAASLLAGATPHELSPAAASHAPLSPASAADRHALETLIAGLHPTPEPTVRSFVRSAMDLDPGALQGVAGMKVEKTLGPFIDRLGIEHFVDLLGIPKKIAIEGTGGALALLILGKVPQPSPQPAPVKLGPGSLWIAVHALIGGTAAGFVGLEFSEGTAELVNVQSGPGGALMLKAGSKLTLHLTLAHTTPPVVTSSVGGDAVALSVTLPAHVTIVFEAPGAAITALDDSAAALYTTSFKLTRNAAKPHVSTYGAPYILVPCNVSLASFAVSTCASSDFVTSGAAAVKTGGWALAIANTPAAGLGVPDGAGSLALELGPGIAAAFGSLAAPTPLPDIAFLLRPAAIAIFAHTGKRELHERLLLWGPPPAGAQTALPPPIRRVSELDLTYPRGTLVTAAIAPGSEIVTISCTVAANLDRPLAADGSRLPLAYAVGFARFIDDSAGKRALVAAQAPPQTERGHVLVLENALVGTGPSNVLAFLGTRAGPAWTGRLGLALPMRGIVPTLPDPYAASFPPQQLIDRPTEGSLVAFMAWTLGSTPGLVFSATGAAIPMRTGFTLLDVSTNADQFGVSALGDAATFSIDGLALESLDRGLAVYALPGISWEPVVSDVPPAPVDWQNAFSPDDGPATLLRTASVDLVRVEPAIALPHFQKRASGVLTRADFTLPFGVLAHLTTSPQTDPDLQPTFLLNDAHYKGGLRNGLQLSIVANPNSFIPHSSHAIVPPDPARLSGPALPGFATTGSPPAPNPLIYGVQVLGFQPLDAGFFFDQQFTDEGLGGKYPGIPVSRIDLSGYGTSMFSDWHHQDIHFVGVVRARFDVLIGRTAYELLVLQSVIGPWSIRITRAIIFDRYDTGLIVKHDTGWKPVGLGAFELLAPSQVIASPMQSLGNIHNIVIGTGPTISATGPDTGRTVDWVPVTFDADLNLDFARVSTLANGKVNGPPACTRIAGFAQLTVGSAATPDELLALMDKVGPAGVTGQLGCILSVGALTPGMPQFTLNVSSLRATATSTRTAGKSYAAAVAVALNGTPRLPRDGAWSIARRARTAQTPTAVDATAPVPLVRAGSQWRLLDPTDAAAPDTPATFYGVLQGAGTAKTLFEHPIIDDLGGALNIDPGHLPNLADVGALLGSADIFPNLGAVLSLDTQPNPLNLVGDGFKQTYDQPINQPDRTVFQLGIIKIVLSYKAPPGETHVTFRLDPGASPRWSLDITNLSFKVAVDGFGSDSDPLLTIYGNFSASETSQPGVKNIQVEYGSALNFVKTVFSGLGPLIQAVGGEVDLDVGFSKNHLSVRDYLAVPTIPLGFGDIHDITVELGFDAVIPSNAGFHVGLGSREKPFTWLVSPLSGTGAIVLGVDKGDLDVYVEAGIGAGLEINLAVASGAASITLELAIEIEGGTISVTVALMGHAEVDVLGGLASAALTLTASITLTPEPLAFPPNDIQLTAAVAVGIHISICWVVSIDFDGSWQFSQDVPVDIL